MPRTAATIVPYWVDADQLSIDEHVLNDTVATGGIRQHPHLEADLTLEARSVGAEAIGDLTFRQRAHIAGRVRSITINRRESFVETRCVVADPTGAITLVFHGRPTVPGLERGTHPQPGLRDRRPPRRPGGRRDLRWSGPGEPASLGSVLCAAAAVLDRDVTQDHLHVLAASDPPWLPARAACHLMAHRRAPLISSLSALMIPTRRQGRSPRRPPAHHGGGRRGAPRSHPDGGRAPGRRSLPHHRRSAVSP